jgi:N-ethylmaleimide reductase
MYIANSDLVERIRGDLPLNAYGRSTFYGGDERGYTDTRVSAIRSRK